MGFFQRALCYVGRKRSKSFLLFLFFLTISTMILCSAVIVQTAQATSDSIREKMGTKLILERSGEENAIPVSMVSHMAVLSGVTEINRSASGTAAAVDFTPVVTRDGDEPYNQTVSIHGYDNTEKDGPFAQEQYRLLEGVPITKEQHGVIINSILAEMNQLQIGDQITFETENGKTASGEIVGLSFTGMERKQEDEIASTYRLENQIFVDMELFESLFETDGFDQVSVYTDQPEQLGYLQEQLEQMTDESIQITQSDTLYRQMQAPFQQVIRITTWMLGLIVATSVIVLSLLLCMWMKSRTKEMAVYISLGISKWSLLLQTVTESGILFVLSVSASTAASSVLTKQVIRRFLSGETMTAMSDVHIENAHLLTLLGLGSGIMMIAVGIAIFPTLLANPRDTLSRMEE